METNLSWFEKNITPKTSAYKDFEYEVKNTSSEHFFQDGERIFTAKENKFMKILEYKNSKNKSIAPFLKKEELKSIIINNDPYAKNAVKQISEKSQSYQSDEPFNPHLETTIEGYSKNELLNLPNNELEHLLSLKKEQFKTEVINDHFEAMSFINSEIKELESIIQNKLIINNQNPKIMETKKEFDQVEYLKNQLKYLGFGEGEKLHKDLEKGINSKKQQFEIKTTSDKTLSGNKVDFTMKYNKSESGGVFLNAYNANLKNEKGEEISHNFPVNRENTFTAKEAINLLEGRSVKIEFHNPKSDQQETAFVQFNFEEPKTEKGNYNFQNFHKNYGVDTAQIVEKSNLIFDKPEWKESTIKSLEKGNIVKVKFELDDKVIEGKAVLNPQYKNMNLYDSDMNRINTNKPLEGLEQDNKHEKNNVKEQSIKR